MSNTNSNKHALNVQEFTHESRLFKYLTDEETEKVCGGVTKLEFEEFKTDFKLAKVDFTAEFLTLKF
ncbi:hypothetical protein AMR41_16570 [Hapalosiphon sp. MRB220]|nr:hypothetical protein AMR41_16570 [Hapalosiphon sp. MRB220]